MEVARLNNLSRVQRCGQIMGRAEAGEMSSAQIFYPCMQVGFVGKTCRHRRSGRVYACVLGVIFDVWKVKVSKRVD